MPAHLVLGVDPQGEPLGDLGLAIFALAVPRLADAECALGEVDVLNPQGGDLAKAQTDGVPGSGVTPLRVLLCVVHYAVSA